MVDAKRPKQPPREHVAVRIDDNLRKELESLRGELSTPWHDATISDVLRLVMIAGIEAVQKKRARGGLQTDRLPRLPDEIRGRRPPQG